MIRPNTAKNLEDAIVRCRQLLEAETDPLARLELQKFLLKTVVDYSRETASAGSKRTAAGGR